MMNLAQLLMLYYDIYTFQDNKRVITKNPPPLIKSAYELVHSVHVVARLYKHIREGLTVSI